MPFHTGHNTAELGEIFSVSLNTAGNTTYTSDDSAGARTCAYIIDSGIQADHPEFEGHKYLHHLATENLLILERYAISLVGFSENPSTELFGHGRILRRPSGQRRMVWLRGLSFTQSKSFTPTAPVTGPPYCKE